MSWFRSAETFDRAGFAVSVACGVHCVLTPLVVGAAASLPVGWLFSERTEAMMLAVAAALGSLSLLPAYLRRHGRKRCLAMFAFGAALLLVSRFALHGGAVEPWLIAGGATMVAAAHWTNLRLCRSCRDCRHS